MIPKPVDNDPLSASSEHAVAVVAGGCFWCTEAVYLSLDGVISVTPGYAGGEAHTANYEQVCGGRTGHAEAIRIEYDPSRLSYGDLLQVFFGVAHDPTQLNRQGNDIGPQYRSAIFPQDARQAEIARHYIDQLNGAQIFGQPIVTTIEENVTFYPAEQYHHNYAELHPTQPYICAVAMPKVHKLENWLGSGESHLTLRQPS